MMGLYVEVMCDERIVGCDPLDEYNLRALCWSDRNDNPQGGNVADARSDAKRQGWKLGKGNAATCPGCAAALRAQKDATP